MTHDLPSVCSLNKYCLSEQAMWNALLTRRITPKSRKLRLRCQSYVFFIVLMTLSDLEILRGMNETLDTKLEGKQNFPGHGVCTGRCALTWNNLFLASHCISLVGFQVIFEKHASRTTARPHFREPGLAQFAQRSDVKSNMPCLNKPLE